MRHPESTRDQAPLRYARRQFGRRAVLAGITASLAGCTSGILDDPSFPDADVIVAPDGESIFQPDELTVPVGETVRWGFVEGGHNVSCRPEDASEVVLPGDAEPFATYGPDDDPDVTLVSRGETYEHTFEVAGQYTYVCIPHADSGMVGTVRVE
jgi:plastocyanin